MPIWSTMSRRSIWGRVGFALVSNVAMFGGREGGCLSLFVIYYLGVGGFLG